MPRQKKKVSRKLVRWTPSEVQTLRKQAGKLSLAQLARQLKRTEASVQLKASKAGISLRKKR